MGVCSRNSLIASVDILYPPHHPAPLRPRAPASSCLHTTHILLPSSPPSAPLPPPHVLVRQSHTSAHARTSRLGSAREDVVYDTSVDMLSDPSVFSQTSSFIVLQSRGKFDCSYLQSFHRPFTQGQIAGRSPSFCHCEKCYNKRR